jgi:hypothetical protein
MFAYNAITMAIWSRQQWKYLFCAQFLNTVLIGAWAACLFGADSRQLGSASRKVQRRHGYDAADRQDATAEGSNSRIKRKCAGGEVAKRCRIGVLLQPVRCQSPNRGREK